MNDTVLCNALKALTGAINKQTEAIKVQTQVLRDIAERLPKTDDEKYEAEVDERARRAGF